MKHLYALVALISVAYATHLRLTVGSAGFFTLTTILCFFYLMYYCGEAYTSYKYKRDKNR